MRILMITIGYPPATYGGTETYVMGLIHSLRERGHSCDAAYLEASEAADCPDMQTVLRTHEGTSVHVIQINQEKYPLHLIQFTPGLLRKILNAFHALIDTVKPDLVHLHPLQLGFESHLIQELDQKGIPVLFTFHSSTTTCIRGDLVFLGRQACDGMVRMDRCVSCILHTKRVPLPIARMLSKWPLSIFRTIWLVARKIPILSRLGALALLPLSQEKRIEAWNRSLRYSKKMIAVCNWVREVALKNGAPPDLLMLSRHGFRGLQKSGLPSPRTGPLRLGYLGRITWEKGLGTLVEALQQIPRSADFTFEFCSGTFSDRQAHATFKEALQKVKELAASDPRIKLMGTERDVDLTARLGSWDALVVPSLWFESGPMVIYEAFSVKTPILGSRRGGIEELVEHGKTGFLFEPGNSNQLAELIQCCILDPDRIRKLRQSIPPPRTFHDVAKDMEKVYEGITGTRSSNDNE